jgi:hypothetical protein
VLSADVKLAELVAVKVFCVAPVVLALAILSETVEIWNCVVNSDDVAVERTDVRDISNAS